MEKIFKLEKDDDDFATSALVPLFRQAEIKHLSSIRKYQVGVGILVLVLRLILNVPDNIQDFSVLILCIITMSYIYTDLRIKILKTFEKTDSPSETNGEQ